MNKIFLMTILLLNFNTLAQNQLPPPGLKGEDQKLSGRWVQLDGACENWSSQTKEKYKDHLRARSYVEYLYINLWDMKFLQSEFSPNTPNPPYEFCERDIYFSPKSTGGVILLKGMEVTRQSQCTVHSVFEKDSRDLVMQYKLDERRDSTWLHMTIYDWPGCGGYAYKTLFRKD